ncbi:transposase [Limnoglobus roseus]|uniref:IS4/IS5 family transposase n=1 Tax=Limnoglobus roseus TaxID=2598579 RepID=A0A5C1AM13_9BACT|nr:transposase [Limnoglobus roseus]QEL19006.1 IS4/IS5 family transposase [Limnoglobus roseus]
MSARRFMGDLDDARNAGLVTHVPHFNSVLNFFDRDGSADTLHDFVARSAAPLVPVETAFATDSTGFAGARYQRWFDEKYGQPKSEVEWIKLHATIGVRTNVVTACKITDKTGADAKQFPELAAKTTAQFDIKEMSADKAYASRTNCDVMEKIGGQFYPAFKQNATGKVGGSYEKVLHLMCLNREDYANHYHKRSNIESTFSAMKRKFSE